MANIQVALDRSGFINTQGAQCYALPQPASALSQRAGPLGRAVFINETAGALAVYLGTTCPYYSWQATSR